MGVVLHYGGQRFDIAERLTADDLADLMRNAIARVEERIADTTNFRLRWTAGEFIEVEPWAFVPLANGTNLRIWLYDGVQFAIEEIESPDHSLTDDAVALD